MDININRSLLLLDKPVGCSSNQAIQKVKRALGVEKVGHSGTLDPMATGLLPIGIGHGTKVLPYLLDANKRYVADIRLGITTSTGDAEGDVLLKQSVPLLSESMLLSLLSHFSGNAKQIPPMYSAIKMAGRPLYALAREGISVERQARDVVFFSLDLLSWCEDSIKLQVFCSKGTYIRSLAEDIGQYLGCGAHLSRLRRIGVAGFDAISDASQLGSDRWCSLDNVLSQDVLSYLLPLDLALAHFPKINCNIDLIQRFSHGQKVGASDLPLSVESDLIYRLYDDTETFYGLVKGTEFSGLMIERWMS